MAPVLGPRDVVAGLTGPLVAAAELSAAFEVADAVQPLRAAAAVARQAAVRLSDDPTGDDLSLLEPAYLRAPRGVAPAAAGGS